MALISLFTAVSALQANQQFMDVVANNLANENTTGFKASRVLFADTLSQTLSAPSLSGGNGAQIGLGTSANTITSIFSQGSLQSTGLPTDLAIEGNGFFIVKDPTSLQTSYTRAGAFSLSPSNVAGIQGYLVTPTGQRVQGAVISSPATSANDGDALTDVSIPTQAGGPPAIDVQNYSIDSSGVVNLQMADGSTIPWMQLSLQNFSNPEALQKTGSNLFQATPPAGLLFPPGGNAGTDVFQTAGTQGLGTFTPGYLESSNVDLGQEFSNMITAQRALEANARIITTSDEILQDLINMKH